MAEPRHNKGFTLAEVLITLGIIGVVAALTIPTLIQNYKTRETVSRLKKTYSEVNEAIKLAVIENGPISHWGLTNSAYDTSEENKDKHIITDETVKSLDLFLDNILKYLKVTERRTYAEYGQLNDYGIDSYTILADGIIIDGVHFQSANCRAKYGKIENICGDIYFKMYKTTPTADSSNGVERFVFWITDTGLVPRGHRLAEDSTDAFEKNCIKGNYKYSCTGWVIENGNMDYLKCPEELSWDGNHECK